MKITIKKIYPCDTEITYMCSKPIRIAICGSRSINDYNILIEALYEAVILDIIPQSKEYIIVSGGAQGVDLLAKEYSIKSGYELIEYKPDYSSGFGRRAPLIRNHIIAMNSDILISLHDGKSTGTLHMISCMKKLNKPTYVKTI